MSSTTSSSVPESMHTRPTVTVSPLRAPLLIDLQRLAGFQDERPFQAQVAQMLRELRVLAPSADIRRGPARKYRGRTRFSTSRSSSALPWPETWIGGFMEP